MEILIAHSRTITSILVVIYFLCFGGYMATTSIEMIKRLNNTKTDIDKKVLGRKALPLAISTLVFIFVYAIKSMLETGIFVCVVIVITVAQLIVYTLLIVKSIDSINDAKKEQKK